MKKQAMLLVLGVAALSSVSATAQAADINAGKDAFE